MNDSAPSEQAKAPLEQTDAQGSYLDVRYTADRRPFTAYPALLCKYLNDTYLTNRSYGTLLELGPGRGEFLHEFAELGFDATGLDSSLFTGRTFPETIQVADLDGSPFPLESNSVDVVFNKSVIEHIHGTDMFLSEIYRVLKPGGSAIIMTPDWKAQFRHFYDDYTHVQPFTMMGLTDVMRTNRFVIREATRFRQLPFLWRRPYLRVLSDLLSLLPERFKKYKSVKFSKEWMLLVVAEKAD